MENKILGNLIKITTSEREAGSQGLLIQPVTLNFLQVKAVTAENLASFVKDLASLSELLDNAIVGCYRLEIGPKLQEKYENLLLELKLKDSKMKYLSGYFKTVTAKMEALLSEIAEKEHKIREAEDRKKKIESNLSSIRGRYKTRIPVSMPVARPVPNTRQARSIWDNISPPTNGDVNLLLEPIEEESTESVTEQNSESGTYELAEDESRWDDVEDWGDDYGLDDEEM